MFRWSFYAIRHGLIIFTILLCGIYFGPKYDPNIYENTYFMLFFLFALPLLLGMALLGGIGCMVKALWYRKRKPHMQFDEEIFDFKDNI